jgi:hypothetical protein
VDVVPPQLVSPKHFPLICPGGIHKVNRSIVMRFISFSILFAVFAILFHGVASADAPAPNPIIQRIAAGLSLQRSERARLQAIVSHSDNERAKNRDRAKLHKQNTLRQFKGEGQSTEKPRIQDTASHVARVTEHQQDRAFALKMADNAMNAKSEEEKAEWMAKAVVSLRLRERARALAAKAHGPQ